MGVNINDKSQDVPMMIVEGVEPSAGDVIDMNKPRTIGNVLQTRGARMSLVGRLAAVARLFIVEEMGMVATQDKGLVADYVQVFNDEWRPIVQWAIALSDESPYTKTASGRNKSITASALAALHIHLDRAGADPVKHMEFATGVATGVCGDETERATFGAMRRRLINVRPLKIGGTGSYTALMNEYAVWIRTYNRWLAGEPVHACKDLSGDFINLASLPKPTQKDAQERFD